MAVVQMNQHRTYYTKWRCKNKATSTASKAVTYSCTLHKECSAEIRVRHLLPTSSNTFELHKFGNHTEEFATPPKGVAPKIKAKAAELVEAGIKPAKGVSILSRNMPIERQPSKSSVASLRKAIKVEERKTFHVDNNLELLTFLRQYQINRARRLRLPSGS